MIPPNIIFAITRTWKAVLVADALDSNLLGRSRVWLGNLVIGQGLSWKQKTILGRESSTWKLCWTM